MLDLGRLMAMAGKEALQLRRDRRSLMMAFLLPLLLLVFFGYAISWDVREIGLAVLDHDRSAESRLLAESFEASGYFEIRARPANARQVGPLFARGEALMVLVVPAGFAADLGAGKPVALQVLVDGSDANTASIALGYAQAVARTVGVRLLARGLPPPAALVAESRVWFNETLESRNMIVPGLVAVILMIIAAMLTSLTIAREWERGTMEQLAATPVGRLEVVLGKLLPYLAIGLADVALCSGLGVWLFGVPFRGSVLLLGVMSAFFLCGSLGLGLFISAVARSQLLATQIAMVVTFLPAFLLSGFMFPIENMPLPLQALTHLVPARYFLVVTRGIFLKDIGLEILWKEGLLMVVYAAVGLALAIRSFKKELPA